jgi:citrate lyase subunit beta / citryl-CoA lyase
VGEPARALGLASAAVSRSRRSCHAVPGSSERFLAKAVGLEADEVFLDLEDAVAPGEKGAARERVIEALTTLEFAAPTLAVRVNGTDTPHYYRDLIEVVERAGARIDAILVPKVRAPGDVEMTDKLLTQLELARGLEVGRIGIEAQIEDAAGLLACEAIATAAPGRLETLVFGPGDYSASVGIPVTTIGGAPDGYPGDHLHYVYSRLVVAARAAGLQVIDGPYGRVSDDQGLRERARLARALGLDGKWTIHPGQIATVNAVFSPEREAWERAEALLAAYREAHAAGAGAATFEGEMIDEASRKMAERIALAGRAAGYGQ